MTITREFSQLPPLIIPAVDLSTALAAMGDEVAVKWAPNSGSVEIQDKFTSIFINLLAGRFPNLASLPTDYSKAHILQFPRAGVVAAAKAASILNSGRVVKLVAQDGVVSLIVEDPELGYFRTVVGTGTGESVEVSLDADYLQTVDTLVGDVTMRILSPTLPVQLEG